MEFNNIKKTQEMSKLDLHGKRHEEVSRILENFLYEHMTKKTREVEIITGNSQQMKTIVKDIVGEYGMEATEQWGNNGIMIVKLV
jgi:DNA-nicking Smr family endonuclease